MGTKDSNQDGDTTDRPAPWWRNRRRWFYLAVLAAGLGCLGGGLMWWTWWYRADFPLLLYAGRLPVAWQDSPWVARGYGKFNQVQWRLIIWKTKRETARMRLEGTTWRDEAAGVRLHFGEEGKLSWEFEPGWDLKPEIADPFGSGNSIRAQWLQLQKTYNGAEYRYSGQMGDEAEGAEIHFPDLGKEGHWWSNGREILLQFEAVNELDPAFTLSPVSPD
jgi:hypothetical protein